MFGLIAMWLLAKTDHFNGSVRLCDSCREYTF